MMKKKRMMLRWCCCVVVVVMMVMREDGDGKKMILTKYVGNNFSVSVLLVSWWSLKCVSVVVGVLVALWWCVLSVLTVLFGDVLGVLLMPWWCFCGVLAVFRGSVFQVFKEWYLIFVWLSSLACQYQIGVKGMKHDTLLLGLYAGLIDVFCAFGSFLCALCFCGELKKKLCLLAAFDLLLVTTLAVVMKGPTRNAESSSCSKVSLCETSETPAPTEARYSFSTLQLKVWAIRSGEALWIFWPQTKAWDRTWYWSWSVSHWYW